MDTLIPGSIFLNPGTIASGMEPLQLQSRRCLLAGTCFTSYGVALHTGDTSLIPAYCDSLLEAILETHIVSGKKVRMSVIIDTEGAAFQTHS